MATRTLTDLEVRILDFAEKHEGQKPALTYAAARAEFGWSAAGYVQKLYAVLDLPAAETKRPLLVHRLQRVRDERSQARASRTFRLVS
ncbi:MAG: DUF3263 domain-containing protein [Pseudolysinimonas sp.]